MQWPVEQCRCQALDEEEELDGAGPVVGGRWSSRAVTGGRRGGQRSGGRDKMRRRS
jgi:hypothetical protein